ncbi:MAG TPA: hypothetical protein VIL86_12545 [Tepidisphaeraceae bacterium]|jgi:hypothetical protein
MRRKLFTILATMSLALLLLVIGIAGRSFWVADGFSYTTISKPGDPDPRRDEITVVSSRGGILLLGSRWRPRTKEQAEDLHLYQVITGFTYSSGDPKYPMVPDRKPNNVARWLGFGAAQWAYSKSFTFTITKGAGITLPLWFPGLLFAILPAIWLRRRRIERKRNRVGFCKTCGYDLRATPLRCPECGTIAAAPAAAAG